jgi:hypothetical protein
VAAGRETGDQQGAQVVQAVGAGAVRDSAVGESAWIAI